MNLGLKGNSKESSAEASFDDDNNNNNNNNNNKENFNMKKVLSAVIEKMGHELYSNIICPGSTESATKNIGKGLTTNKCTQCKIPQTLKADLCELPYNKNIKKLFLKYELFYSVKASSSSDTFQILIQQQPISVSSPPPPTYFCLTIFALENWTFLQQS